MPQYTELSQGNPFWVDLGSPDIAALMSFYTQLFDWGYEEAPEGVAGRRYAGAKIPAGFPADLFGGRCRDEIKCGTSLERPHFG